jgi:hypothetical protein
VAVDFSAIVLSLVSLFVSVSFLDVEVSSISSSQSLEVSVYRSVKVSFVVKVSWCQSVGVRCKNTGAVVGETTLLLDFRTFKTKRSTVCTQVFVA